jgi:hypothetical protein
MTRLDNPAHYIGRTIKVKRWGRYVEAFLYRVADSNTFNGSYVMPDGEAITGMVPFSEVEASLFFR